MNPQAKPFAYPTVSPLPQPQAVAVPMEIDSEARWNKWAEKGRREHAAFKEKSRVVAIIAGIVVSIAAAAWVVVSL
jgi:hypothetical protein